MLNFLEMENESFMNAAETSKVARDQTKYWHFEAEPTDNKEEKQDEVLQ